MDMETYGKMIARIRRYLQKAFEFDLRTRSKSMDKYTNTRQELLTMLASYGLSRDNIEFFIEKMYEDGHLVKDDGQQIWYTWEFFFIVIHIHHQDFGYDNSFKRNRG